MSDKPAVSNLGSPKRSVNRSKRVDEPTSNTTGTTGPKRVAVQPDDLPTGDRISVSIEDKETLAKMKKILGVSTFSNVYHIAMRKLIREIQDEGEYIL